MIYVKINASLLKNFKCIDAYYQNYLMCHPMAHKLTVAHKSHLGKH